MSPIDQDSIAEKKALLKDAIRLLTQLRKKGKEKILEDEIAQGAVLHYLMIGIETILDIGTHVLVEDFGVSPATYGDVIVLLGQKNVVPKTLAERSVTMARFRNKLIHEYADIDMMKVYNFLEKAPDEFHAFDEAFSVYLAHHCGE